MSYLQETAEACERLLIKHEPATDRLNRIRVTPAILRAVQRQGFEVAGKGLPRIASGKAEKFARAVDGRFKPDSMAKSRQAAREWLDQRKPRRLSQVAIALKYGISAPAISIAAARERANRRRLYLAGDDTALLSKVA